MKPAGGIRTAKHAIQHLVMVNETLGPDWLTPDRFRLGASSLLNDCSCSWPRTHRPLPVRRLLHQGLRPGHGRAAGTAGRAGAGPVRRAWTTRPRPRRPTTSSCGPTTGCSSAGGGSSRPRGRASRRSTRPPRRSWPRWPRPARRTSTRPSRPPGPPTQGVVGLPGAERAKYLTGSRGSSRSGPGSSPCWRRWTAASRSRSPATSTCPWPRPTSSTTPAGPTSSTTPSPAAARPRSGWPARSSRGTSRC